MSTAIAKNFQVGSDSTATNNFTIRQPATPDGTVRIANGNSGTTTDLVTVTSAGNVGVGTTSPGGTLHLVASSANFFINQYSADSLGPSAVLAKSRGTIASPSAVLTGDSLALFSGGGYNTSSIVYNKAAVQMYAAENWTTTANGSYMTFATTAIGATGRAEAMRITSAGDVGIGTSSPGAKLEIGALGVFRMQTGSTVFNTTPTAGAADTLVWNTSNAGSGFAWNTNSAERVRITPAGDVGIGTSSPGAKLEVNGSLRASSALNTAGMFIVASGSFNNGSANNIGTFNESHIIIHIVTGGSKLSSIPVYPNGGSGVAFVYNYMNPATAAWTNTGGGDLNFTFSCAGTNANTYNVIMTGGAGTLTVQRTAGSAAYAVYVQRIASL